MPLTEKNKTMSLVEVSPSTVIELNVLFTISRNFNRIVFLLRSTLVNINASNNTIIVGSKDSLIIKKIKLRDLNLLGEASDFDNPIFIKVRSTGKLLKAQVKLNGKKGEVEILEKALECIENNQNLDLIINQYEKKNTKSNWSSFY